MPKKTDIDSGITEKNNNDRPDRREPTSYCPIPNYGSVCLNDERCRKLGMCLMGE